MTSSGDVNRASETRGRCVKISAFIVIYGLLCRVKNEIMYFRDELLMYSHECYVGIYFPRCFATEIKTKITLP